MTASAQMGDLVTQLFREAWPRHAAKHAAIAAEVPHETARSWIKRRAVPSADRLLRMAERDEALAAALERQLADRRAHRAAARQGGRAPMAGAADRVTG